MLRSGGVIRKQVVLYLKKEMSWYSLVNYMYTLLLCILVYIVMHVITYVAVEHYEKGEVKEMEIAENTLSFHSTCIHMKVNNGSKIKNLMGFAISKMKVSDLHVGYVFKLY